MLDGMGTPEDIVKRARDLGWGAVGLTEHGWMGSAPSFYKAARAHKVNPVIGCEFYIVPDEILGEKGKRAGSFHLTVLALSAEDTTTSLPGRRSPTSGRITTTTHGFH